MKKKGNVYIVLGILLIIIAIGFVGFNLSRSYIVEVNTKSCVNDLIQSIDQRNKDESAYDNCVSDLPDFVLYPEKELPVVNIDGNDYIGILKLPALGLSLPVLKDYSNSALQFSPCCYFGSPYTKNMVVAAHNYSSHFGRLSELSPDDEIVFVDVDGNCFYYRVVVSEILNSKAVEEMIQSEYDLTLFTCTVSGYSRLTVRCNQIDS